MERTDSAEAHKNVDVSQNLDLCFYLCRLMQLTNNFYQQTGRRRLQDTPSVTFGLKMLV